MQRKAEGGRGADISRDGTREGCEREVDMQQFVASTPGSSPLVAPMDPPSGAPCVDGAGAVDDVGGAASAGGLSGPQLPLSPRTGNAVPYPVSLDSDVNGRDSSAGVGGVVVVRGVGHASGLDGADFADSISSITTSGVFTDSTSVSSSIGVRCTSGIGCELGRLPAYSRKSFADMQERLAMALRSGWMPQMTVQTEVRSRASQEIHLPLVRTPFPLVTFGSLDVQMTRIDVYVQVYSCPRKYMHVCILSPSQFLFLSLSIQVCVYISLSLYLSLSLYIYLYISLSLSIYIYLSLSVYIYIYICMYVCMYMCIYIYIYIYTYI